MRDVTVLGAGMGSTVARPMAACGHQVMVWNRASIRKAGQRGHLLKAVHDLVTKASDAGAGGQGFTAILRECENLR